MDMPQPDAARPPRLLVTGLVERPGLLDEEMLHSLARPAPSPAAGAAAVGLGAVLDSRRPSPAASHVTVVNRDGDYSASIPLPEAARGKLLVGAGAGGPIRLNVPQGRTLCWNVKDVGTLRLTAGPEPDSVPENPPH